VGGCGANPPLRQGAGVISNQVREDAVGNKKTKKATKGARVEISIGRYRVRLRVSPPPSSRASCCVTVVVIVAVGALQHLY
jgi:hypothetical protein